MKVSVVGLGLIGGSFALALRSKGIATELIGVESSPLHAAKALELGIVDSVLPLQQAIEGADLIDGTPVYDIKPYLSYTDCHTDATGGFADDVDKTFKNVDLPAPFAPIIP